MTKPLLALGGFYLGFALTFVALAGGVGAAHAGAKVLALALVGAM